MQTGRLVLGLLAEIGRLALFTRDALVQGLMPPLFLRQTGDQLLRIGYFSLPVVGLTAFFTGGVLALQIYIGGSRFNAESLVSSIVALGITRELGPVLAGLMVAGRVAAAIAAELGTMRVTQEIDALQVMGLNPVSFLVVPRLIALIVTMPCLVVFADIIGILGGQAIAVGGLGLGPDRYVALTLDSLVLQDVYTGLIKAASFGALIGLVGCHEGLKTSGGAEEVGLSTTSAVVRSIVLIIVADLFATALFYVRG